MNLKNELAHNESLCSPVDRVHDSKEDFRSDSRNDSITNISLCRTTLTVRSLLRSVCLFLYSACFNVK